MNGYAPPQSPTHASGMQARFAGRPEGGPPTTPACVSAEPLLDPEWPHIISARKAEKHEREAWTRFCK